MKQRSHDGLRKAVEAQHNCKATFREVAFVRESHEGQTVWEGGVSVFDLEGHPEASTAYAWAEDIPGTNRERVFAIIQAGPIQSPADAVKAAILVRFQQEIDKA